MSLRRRASTVVSLILLMTILVVLTNCGGGTQTQNVASGGSPGITFNHVFLLVEENRSYSDVISSTSMPYLNSLANSYGLATQYYANVHSSLPDYFMLTAGELEAMDDSFSGTVTDNNIVRALVAAHKTWKSYAESLPSTGYTGGDVYPYVKRHNPFAYLSDVSGQQAGNLVPVEQLSADLASGSLPNFSFIVPNLLDDAHDGTLSQADQWLQNNIAPLINSSAFQQDGLMIIVFDESEDTDIMHGGGHVPAIVVSTKAKRGFQSTTFYQHQSTLRFILTSLGISDLPGESATAPQMSEFFP